MSGRRKGTDGDRPGIHPDAERGAGHDERLALEVRAARDAAESRSHEVLPSGSEADDPDYRRAREHARAKRDAERAYRASTTGELPRVDPVVSDDEPRSQTRYSFGVVVLSQGKRPPELLRAFDSLFAQKGVDLDVVCVGNGWEPTGLPDAVKTVALPENVGIPAGRNEGVPHVRGEFLFFLDDDAWMPDETTLLKMAQLMRAEPTIGLIQPRVADPDNDDAPLRWIPRIRKGDSEDSSHAFSVWEGAVCLQRSAYDEAGGWPAPFWYAHEGIELAWRIWDAGYRVWYMGDVTIAHEVHDPARHDEYFYMNARNRVWLARRNLPWPVSWAYVGSWTLVQTARWRKQPDQLKPWFQGWRDGWRNDPWGADETRGKLSGRGIIAMTRHGRPPII